MTPEELGFDSRRLPRIADLTHRYVDEGKWPCALVAVRRHGAAPAGDLLPASEQDQGGDRLDPEATGFRQ